MNNPMEKLDTLLQSIHIDDIDHNDKIKENKIHITMILLFISIVITLFNIASLNSLFSNMDINIIIKYIILYLSSGLVFFTSLKFLKKGFNILFPQFQNMKDLKKTTVKKIDKNFIFELFLSFEKISIIFPKKTKLFRLQNKIEQSMLTDNYQTEVFDLLKKFKDEDYNKIKEFIDVIMLQNNIKKEYEEYKQSIDHDDNTNEINSEKNIIFKNSL